MAFFLRPLQPEIASVETFWIPRGERIFRVGREEGSDLRLDRDSISARHARIEVLGEATVEVIDCESSNGTFVNGVRVERSSLSEGDLLRFADAEFLVQTASSVSGEGAEASRQRTEEAKVESAEEELERLRRELGEERTESERLRAELSRERGERERRERQLLESLSGARRATVASERLVAELRYEAGRAEARLRESEDRVRNLSGRLAALGERLLEDWRAWIGEASLPEDGGEDAIFAKVEGAAELVRRELDRLEPVWREFGEGMQEELSRRCARLRDELAEVEGDLARRKAERAEVETDLARFRQWMDSEIRRAQGLSRKGVEVEIPERYETMVIARDRELDVYRALVERIEALDGLIGRCGRSWAGRSVVRDLREFRAPFASLLEAGGVKSFEVERGLVLAPKHRRLVQIFRRKGWGTKAYSERPYHPGEVVEVVRCGYRIGEGEDAVILRKVGVLVREAGDAGTGGG